MSLIDVYCLTCGAISEVVRAARDWPATPPCPACGQATEQRHYPKAVQWTPEPVVVFQAADGSIRFPGDAHGLSARTYERQGLRRIEIRGAIEMRRFEAHMNKAEYARACRQVEAKHAAREARETVMRAHLRQQFSQMSERGRELARFAMRRNDQRPREKAAFPEFHNQAYSYDHGNREESRDAQGRRRRD